MTPHEEILAAHDYALIDPYVISLTPDWAFWRELPMQPLVPDTLRHIAREMPCLLPLKPFEAPHIKDLRINLEMAERYPESASSSPVC